MTLELPGVSTSPAVARHVVRAGLVASGEAADLDALELITSELVANAIACTAREVTVTMTARVGGSVLLEVADQGAGWPMLPGSAVDERVGGLGLPIVDALATAWGCVENPDQGKTVWVEAPPPLDGSAPRR